MGIHNQQHHFEYRISYVQRGYNEPQTTSVIARTIDDALVKFCHTCIDEDNTGIFFELENADLESLKKNRKFHIVKTRYGLFGIILTDLEIISDRRNANCLALRAKRELLGLSIEDMIRLVNNPSYKGYEQGGRPMKYSLYQSFMNALIIHAQEEKTDVTDKINEMVYEIKSKLTKDEAVLLIDRLRTNYIDT